jgi:hypothetical protein
VPTNPRPGELQLRIYDKQHPGSRISSTGKGGKPSALR